MFWLYVGIALVVLLAVATYLGRRGSRYLRDNVSQDERNRVNQARTEIDAHTFRPFGSGGPNGSVS